MNIVPSLIFNVAVLFIMMIPGVILKTCKLVPDGFGKGVSNLVLYIAQPALIFLAYVRPYDAGIFKNSIIVLVLSIITHTLFSIIALLCFKTAPDAIRRMLRFATIFSNAAFMGIPLISVILGSDATIYASVYNITFNMFLWSLGVYICTADRDEDGDGVTDGDVKKKKKSEASFKRAILHPVTIAAALGLVFFFLPIEGYIPALIIDSLTMLKNLVAPLSMLVIGLRLADIDFRGFFSSRYLYEFLALRHVILPIFTFAIMWLLKLCGVAISNEVFMVVLILASAPAASSATMFAEKYDCDAAYVSKAVTVSTILSIVTMPLLCMLEKIF